ITLSLALLSTLCLLVKPVSANPLPISWDYRGTGIGWNSTISMPKADVNISIVSSQLEEEEFSHHVELSSRFEIYNMHSLETPIAFVFPPHWTSNELELGAANLSIRVDDEDVEFTLSDYDGLDIDINIGPGYSWIWDEYFAVFNVSLVANVSSVLSVNLETTLVSIANEFHFQYVVGSARTWNGTGHEKIIIEVDDRIPFLHYDFMPNENLTLDLEQNYYKGTWEFYDYSFTFNHVGFYATQFMSTGSDDDLTPLLYATVFVGIIVFVVVVIRKKQ
ncbi:MAG: hypothetical protein ACFE7R_06200, partial [Candidatus Hodarchaeota archaeon]